MCNIQQRIKAELHLLFQMRYNKPAQFCLQTLMVTYIFIGRVIIYNDRYTYPTASYYESPVGLTNVHIVCILKPERISNILCGNNFIVTFFIH